jgi:catechol 2,3-dioxygenase-like lactoylglutathione lyase family enzyme
MAVKALAHICIHTKDLDKTRNFYCDVLGFKKIFNFTKNGEVVGFYLKISKNNFLEFFKDGTSYSNQSSLKHFCLETDNITGMRNILMKNNIDSTEITLGCDNTYQFWFKDPGGIDVEFHQYTGKSSQRACKDVEINW